MSRKKTKRRTGHFCWSCGRMRANEKFSGGGHARHLCKDCSKLGSEELAFRQAQRDLYRCLTFEGNIPRKQRRTFSKFLEHANPRIRSLAHELGEEDLLRRAEHLMQALLDEAHLIAEDSEIEFENEVLVYFNDESA